MTKCLILLLRNFITKNVTAIFKLVYKILKVLDKFKRTV